MNDQMLTIALPRLDDKKAMQAFANANLSSAIRCLISARIAYIKANEDSTLTGLKLLQIESELRKLRASMLGSEHVEIVAAAEAAKGGL